MTNRSLALSANSHGPVSPDEPEHVRRCPECNRFLPRAGWGYELIPEERVVLWSHECYCGHLVTEER